MTLFCTFWMCCFHRSRAILRRHFPHRLYCEAVARPRLLRRLQLLLVHPVHLQMTA